MLSEISSSLNQYYLKSPYKRNRNNLIYNQKEYNSEQINNHQYNNKSKKIENIKNRIILNNKLGSNFTFKSDDIYTPNIINKSKIIKRPKSEIKRRININNNNNRKSLTNKFKINENDFDLNSNMIKFENLINIIDKNGFQRYQDEINDKKIIISELENSIAILKNKISLLKNDKNKRFHIETKNKIKYENMLSASNKYKNSGKSINKYKNDIDIIKNKILFLNEQTLNIRDIFYKEQNEVDELNNEIKKGNKAISDRQKQIENILAATQLLKKHIISVKQKLGRIKNNKYNYIDQLNYIENNI